MATLQKLIVLLYPSEYSTLQDEIFPNSRSANKSQLYLYVNLLWFLSFDSSCRADKIWGFFDHQISYDGQFPL
jgi:hypothetical protein